MFNSSAHRHHMQVICHEVGSIRSVDGFHAL